ncbi:hypothetical protein BDY21DRAFT_1738 [Lineolata rhizophorae]|uniref:BTB domain-containing protein n=1 Tax=Lineolata rhizophorae TaxID=578093 RepID=A0A6A6PDF1_9PEZI|nr:hypothetical protein BDY21DRAFT_1738 [Lineolata rhizophorae]
MAAENLPSTPKRRPKVQKDAVPPRGDTSKDITIAPGGDIVLSVHDGNNQEEFHYRVAGDKLKGASPYFANLLSGRFGEAMEVAKTHEALKSSYVSISDVPFEELPRINIADIGKISKVQSIRSLMADFLHALHGQDLSSAHPPMANLANLTIVADRFEALSAFSKFAHRRMWLQALDGRQKQKGVSASVPEERTRQKVLVGTMLNQNLWFSANSKKLVVEDSSRWNTDEIADDPSLPLWWHLPSGVEVELVYRRECVLETINSLQSHFLKLYTSGERQCRLGYDSSVQCDSFQLGEMVRYFCKIGTLRLQGTIFNDQFPEQYSGDIGRLLDSLRQCPNYQIDQNHQHCGLRTRLVPLLDLIQSLLSLGARSPEPGICAECWAHRRKEYAWKTAKRPLLWSFTANQNKLRLAHQARDCFEGHLAVRDMFTATERDWTGTKSLNLESLHRGLAASSAFSQN